MWTTQDIRCQQEGHMLLHLCCPTLHVHQLKAQFFIKTSTLEGIHERIMTPSQRFIIPPAWVATDRVQNFSRLWFTTVRL